MARGLNEARNMRDHGALSLGVEASRTSAHGVLNYSHRMNNFTAFTRGFGGMVKGPLGWENDFGITAGIGLEW